jgi:Flp pilus assembly protein TadD
MTDNEQEAQLELAGYNESIALNPNDAEAYCDRGIFYARRGQLD